MIATPLRRNRDFLLLQTGQLLSSAGSHSTAIAYPLLTLAVTGSAAKAGAVGFAQIVPLALFALPAGVAADRWNRKWLMLAGDAVRVLAVGGLGVAIVADRVPFWAILLVAFVEGAGTAVFSAGYAGALRAVVRLRDLPAAAAVQTGRDAVVRILGPPLGGALFGLARALPFLVDAVSYAFSTVSLLLMRTPFQQERQADPAGLRARVAEGFRFVWNQPFVRTSTLLFGLANVLGPGLLFAVVVIATRQGLSGAEAGALLAAFGGCVLLGSFLSPLVRRRLPVRAVMVLELWTWPGCAAFVLWPDVYVLVAALIPTALAIPSTDSVVHGYRIAITPDRLLGRSESVRSTISLVLAPFGPLAAGLLLGAASERATIAAFAVFAVALAVWGTASRAIREAPSLDDLPDAR